MARWGYFEHASPNGAAFWRRIAVYYQETGYRRWTVGENLEYGQPGLEALEVLQDWLASPPHRANVVSRRFRDAGIGVVFVESGAGVFGGMPTTIVTLDVGSRSALAALAEPSTQGHSPTPSQATAPPHPPNFPTQGGEDVLSTRHPPQA